MWAWAAISAPRPHSWCSTADGRAGSSRSRAFQAELLTAMRPRAAVFLNLSQDHLERHSDVDAYLEAKRRLFAFQEDGDFAVLNADDEAVAATVTAARRRTFSITGEADARLDGDRLLLDGELLVEASKVKLSGIHNLGQCSRRRARGAGARCEDRCDGPGPRDL